MKVSVCVPTYNGAAFLSQTLDSITAQTFDDFEVIIVDDMSTDETIAIAEAYVAAETRARFVRNAERAGSSARNANKCLRHARGEWIKFLFQDDLMAPTCLARMLEAGERGRFVVAWHGYVFAHDVDAVVRHDYESLPSLATVFPTAHVSVDEFCDAVLGHWGVNFIGPTSSSFIHRDCFTKYGEFSSEIRMVPDLEYWMRVGSREGLAIVPEPLVTFRVHNASVSGGIRKDAARRYPLPLEPLLLLLELARSPEYENLRRRAPRQNPPIDPEQSVRDAAFDTRWFVGETRYRERNGELLEQWNAFCARHPAMLDVLRQVDASMPLWGRFKQFVKARL